eukprot:m.832579 g.832579  ORF g.832579 m.832579 type:complete len:342 (+) comp59464_c2_seq2:97-1122(+)
MTGFGPGMDMDLPFRARRREEPGALVVETELPGAGKLCFSGDEDNSVTIADLRARTTQRISVRNPKRVSYSSALSLVAVGMFDSNEALVFDANTAEQTMAIEHSGKVFAVRFVGKRPELLSGDKAGEIILTDVVQRRRLRSVGFFNTLVSDIAVSWDLTLAIASYKEQAVVFRIYDDAAPVVLAGHMSPVMSCGFLVGDRHCVTCSDDRTVRRWSCEAGAMTTQSAAHSGWVQHLAVHPNGKIFATACNDRSIILWNPENLDVLHTLLFPSYVWSVAFIHDTSIVVGGVHDRGIMGYDYEQGLSLGVAFPIRGYFQGLDYDITGSSEFVDVQFVEVQLEVV